MKVLHAALVRSDRSSGVSVYVQELLRALAAQGELQVGLLPALAGVDPEGAGRIPGCSLLEPAPRRLRPWGLDAAWPDRIERSFGRPDLVNFHSVYDPFHAALALRLKERGWKYAVSPHGALQASAQANKALKKTLGNLLFFDRFMRGAAAAFATSPVEKAFIESRYPGLRTTIAPNGVSEVFLARAADVPAPPPRAGRPFTLGYVGRLDVHHKGLDHLLGAMAVLEGSGPEIHLVVAGPFHRPADERSLKSLRARLRHPQRVEFIGPRHGEAKLAALAGFDAFIHASRHEGMPGAVLEAMAASRPCILTPGTNLQHVAADHGCGWACGGDPRSIAAAVAEAAAAAPEELARRGRAARRYVAENLTWPALARGYAAEVRALLA